MVLFLATHIPSSHGLHPRLHCSLFVPCRRHATSHPIRPARRLLAQRWLHYIHLHRQRFNVQSGALQLAEAHHGHRRRQWEDHPRREMLPDAGLCAR